MQKAWSDPALRPQLLLTWILALLTAIAFHLLLLQRGAADSSSLGVAALIPLAAFTVWQMLACWGVPALWLASEGLILTGFGLAFLPAPLGGTAGDASLVLRLLAGLRNIVLVAAALSDRPRTLRIPAMTGTVMVMICFSLARGWGIFLVATLFAAAAVAWLGMGSWRAFVRHLPVAPAPKAPWSWAVGLALLGGGSFVAGVLVYPSTSQGLLDQVLQPTMQAGNEEAAEHVAPNRQELKSLAAEKYGATSGAAGLEAVGMQEDSEEATEQFSLIRQPPASSGTDLDRVLFQVKEQGPGHIPLATYDHLDGTAWRAEAGTGTRTQITAELNEGKGWRRVLKPFDFRLGEPEGSDRESPRDKKEDAVEASRRALGRLALALQGGGRVVAPERLPLNRALIERLLATTPANYGHLDYRLTGYDLDRIREQLAADPKLGKKLARRNESSPELREEVLQAYLDERMHHPDAALPADLRALLSSWVGSTPRGWGQVEAVIQGLRRHARHDPDAAVPADEPDPLRWFLLKSRRGPDYLFASSAVVFLRHLGYPSRLVGGFFVRPGDYRLLSQTTPVRAGDVHYWAQVWSPTRIWINLEPTPGYEPARPSYTFRERLAQLGRAIQEGARRHGPALLAVLIAGAAGLLFRHRLAERLATVGWHLSSGRPARRLVRATWQLIDRRARTAGVARGQGTTLPAWSAAVRASTPVLGEKLAELAVLADWMTHAPASMQGRLDPPDTEVRAACRLVVEGCTVGALRRALGRRQGLEKGSHDNHHC